MIRSNFIVLHLYHTVRMELEVRRVKRRWSGRRPNDSLIHGCQRWQTFNEMANRVQLTIPFSFFENVWPSVKYWTHNGKINLFLCELGSFCCPEVLYCCQRPARRRSETQRKITLLHGYLYLSLTIIKRKKKNIFFFCVCRMCLCEGMWFKSVYWGFDPKEKDWEAIKPQKLIKKNQRTI